MRHVAAARREFGKRTIFNLLGPLSNPAGVKRQLVGVFAPNTWRPWPERCACSAARTRWVVHGAGGLDELSALQARPGHRCHWSTKARWNCATSASRDRRRVSGVPEIPMDACAAARRTRTPAALRALLNRGRWPAPDIEHRAPQRRRRAGGRRARRRARRGVGPSRTNALRGGAAKRRARLASSAITRASAMSVLAQHPRLQARRGRRAQGRAALAAIEDRRARKAPPRGSPPRSKRDARPALIAEIKKASPRKASSALISIRRRSRALTRPAARRASPC